MERTIQAYGGIDHIRDFYKKLKTYSGTEQVDLNPPHSCTQRRAGDFYRTDRKMPHYSQSSGYNGHVYWSCNRGLVETRTPAQAPVDEFYRTHSTVAALLSWHKGLKLMPLPNRTVGGRACSGFSVPVAGSTPIDLWTYNDSGFIARVHYSDKHQSGTDDIVSECFDYRTVQGIHVPFRVLTVRAGQKVLVRWQDVKLSNSAAIAQFSPPNDPNRLTKAIACRLDQKSNYPIVDGLIQNSKAKILLDTGASITVLNSIFAETIHATPQKVDQTKLKGIFSEVPAGFSSLPHMSLGDLNLTDVPVMVRVGDRPWYAVILGVDVLGRYAMAIDFVRHEVTFSPNAPAASPDMIVLPMRANDRPFIQAKINDGNSETFLVDTGAPDNLIQTASTIKSLKLPADQPKVKLRDSAFVTHTSVPLKLQSIQIGNLKLKNQQVYCIPDAKNATYNVLGLEFMKQFSRVIFDFPNNRLMLVNKKN